METVVLQKINTHMVDTLIALLIIVLAYSFIHFFFIRKIDGSRRKRSAKIRAFYIACLIFLFVITRIWIEGFTHLLAVLGLVSAALVVTNKETIMNVVGWLIITWRGLFSEDDLIQVQQYKGYVKSIGILYITLFEVSEGFNGNISGRVIRVPNGLVSTNALINFSQASQLFEQRFSLVITQESCIDDAINFVRDKVNEVVADFYKGNKEFSLDYFAKYSKQLAKHLNLETKIVIRAKLDKPTGIELNVSYYCLSPDADKLQHKIWMELLESIKQEENITVSYS